MTMRPPVEDVFLAGCVVGVILGSLAVYMDPIPCAHPAQTGCGVDPEFPLYIVTAMTSVILVLRHVRGANE